MVIQLRSNSRISRFFTSAFAKQLAYVIRFIWKHPANRGSRGSGLLRFALFQFQAQLLHQRTQTALGQRSRIWTPLHRQAVAKVVCANPPDYAEMMAWRRVLRPGDLFVDVGANVGTYTIWAAELGAEVVALEPAPDTFALLEENVALNDYPVETLHMAAGAICGTCRFTSGLDALNRMDPEGAAETAVVTIDSIINDRVVAGIKIDVEGFEIEVLRGCEHALSDGRIEMIQMEWNSCSMTALGSDRRPVADLLAKYGYALYRPNRNGSLVPVADASFGSDVFACPADKRVVASSR